MRSKLIAFAMLAGCVGCTPPASTHAGASPAPHAKAKPTPFRHGSVAPDVIGTGNDLTRSLR